MRALSATELLGVWERGALQTPPQRAMALLATVLPDVAPNELEKLSIGRRDGLLFTFRTQVFGPHLASLVNCPGCGEHIELSFNTSDLVVAQEPEHEATGEFSLSFEDFVVQFRLPTSGDLTNLADSTDPATARDRLLDSCLLAAHHQGMDVPARKLPTGVVAAIAERMAKADPQADVQLDLHCPACEQRWQATFDIVGFLWSEINAWASRVLRDVHALASTYGWTEPDILAMHPLRRQRYLEMIST